MLSYRTAMVAIIMTAGMLGCGGGDDKFEYAAVSGTVTLNGEPVYDAQVLFVPVSAGEKEIESGKSGSAKTDAEGKYSIDQVTVGKNTVSVMLPYLEEGTEEEEDDEMTPPAATLEKNTYDVPSGGGTIDLKLTEGAFGGADDDD